MINCIECQFHKIIQDPDPHDWFNDDDEAIVCTKCTQIPDTKSKYSADRSSNKVIEGSLRPYETKNVKIPNWCPISITNKREEKLNTILPDDKK